MLPSSNSNGTGYVPYGRSPGVTNGEDASYYAGNPVINEENDDAYRDALGPHQDQWQQQMLQQQQSLSQQSYGEQHTRVNGIGIWESWKKNFKSPKFALLDLFDNAIDACFDFREDVSGRVGEISVSLENSAAKMNKDKIGAGAGVSRSYEKRCTEMLLRNNSSHPISPIGDILELYKSHKDTSTIGQNGIGTKQACANLCDLSFIITKNKDEISMGVIAKSLQTEAGPYLPSITFMNQGDSTDATLDVYQQLQALDWTRIFSEYGEGIRASVREGYDGLDDEDKLRDLGLERVYQHIQSLIDDTRNDYLFLCVLTKIRHDNRMEILDELKQELPVYYVHVPPAFKVTINDEKIDFQYWEKRLVELSVFHLKVHPNVLWYENNDYRGQTGEEKDIDNAYDNIRLFIGFDPYGGFDDNDNSKEAKLYIYSRRSGRLVKHVKDARGYLKLTTGSSTYCQGLTILVDDYNGSLPLTPTKQDLAFSLEANGETHEKNFETWLSAFVHMYYHYHFLKFGDRKDRLTSAVKSAKLDLEQKIESIRQADIENGLLIPSFASLDVGTFTTIKNITWINIKSKSLRCFKKQQFTRQKGKDTLAHLKHLDDEILQKQKQQKEDDKKRKYQEEALKNQLLLQSQQSSSQQTEPPLSQSMSPPSSINKSSERARKRPCLAVSSASEGFTEHLDDNAEDNDDNEEDYNSGDDTPRRFLSRPRTGTKSPSSCTTEGNTKKGIYVKEEGNGAKGRGLSTTQEEQHRQMLRNAELESEVAELKKKYKSSKKELKEALHKLLDENEKLCNSNDSKDNIIKEKQQQIYNLQEILVSLQTKLLKSESLSEKLKNEKFELERKYNLLLRDR